MPNKKWRMIGATPQTLNQLRFLSAVYGVPIAKLIRNISTGLTSLVLGTKNPEDYTLELKLHPETNTLVIKLNLKGD